MHFHLNSSNVSNVDQIFVGNYVTKCDAIKQNDSEVGQQIRMLDTSPPAILPPNF